MIEDVMGHFPNPMIEDFIVLDPDLLYLETLRPSSLLVYKVEKEGAVYVLKVAKRFDSWLIMRIDQEKQVLALAREVYGITRLIKYYGQQGRFGAAILKEYFDGENIIGRKIDDTKIQKDIEHTVRGLHALGVAGLDIRSSNIILSHDETEARIIDLGCAAIYSKIWNYLPRSRFNKMKTQDLARLEDLFKGKL